MTEGFDIIGDVHGCARALARLLTQLGYRQEGGVFYSPTRKAIFLGDIVDRGPHVREALHLVKAMVDNGTAQCVLGNHEYNALGYTTCISDEPGAPFIRPHTGRHNRGIAETLAQFADYLDEWQMFLAWFRTLPLYLEWPEFRVVHACWDQSLINQYRQAYDSPVPTEAFLRQSGICGSFAHQVYDRLTRGTDLPLPNGTVMYSRDGYERRYFRTKFWARNARTYRDVVFQPDPIPQALADLPLTEADLQRLVVYDDAAPPVFVGHYWLQGRPEPITHNIACLDYSAVKYGRLVAYQFDGESQLNADKFKWVYVDPHNS